MLAPYARLATFEAVSHAEQCSWWYGTTFTAKNTVLNMQVVEPGTITQLAPEAQRETPLPTESAADTSRVAGETTRVMKPKPAATRQESKLTAQANVGQHKSSGTSQRTSTTR